MTVELEFKQANKLPVSASDPYMNREELIFELRDITMNDSYFKDVDEIIIKVIPKTLVKHHTATHKFIDKTKG